MDTPKPRSGSSGTTNKVSPRVARQLKLSPVGFGSSSPASLKDRTSPRIPAERKSPRSPLVPQKKRPGRVTEFETQISELQEDLKRLKQELTASKASAEEAHAIAQGLQQQLQEAQKQHSNDAPALASALDEIQALKNQLHASNCEHRGLKQSLAETLLGLEKMKTEMECCRESEALAQGRVRETLSQLEEAKQAVNALRDDGTKSTQTYAGVALELEGCKARVAFLEGVVAGVNARESELRATIEELKANLMDKENELQFISEENECLNLRLRKSSSNQDKPESESGSESGSGVELKCLREEIANLKEEGEKNRRRAAEQLEAAQAANAELEAELRRLKVQADQWRKAAEAAASMLSSPVGNGGSLDYRSPYLDDYDLDDEEDEDDELKKKNGNVLRKIGGFWKKPQK